MGAPNLRAVDQIGMDEQTIEDATVLNALEARQALRETASEARKEFKEADSKAKAAIERLELPEGGAARVGRFRITRTAVPARSVSFETEASSRYSIGLVED